MEKDLENLNANGTYGFEDTPAKEDKLGLEKYFKGLTAFIRNCPTPMTIAIQGGWGSGKSTAMKMIQKELEDDETLLQIDFNTWQYARVSGDNLFLPLLRRLTEAVLKEVEISKTEEEGDRKKRGGKTKNREKVRNTVIGLVETVIENMNSIGAIAVSIFNNSVKQPDYTEEAGMVYDQVEKLKDKLKEGIRLLQDELGIDRIIFYVDDLDRLDPETAVGFLEDLKNFIEFPNCVFILALDHELVQRGVQKRYVFTEDEKAEEYSARFFDKLIQLPFNLPSHQYDVEQYVASLLDDKERSLEFAEIIRVYGDTNPRAIKRVFNIFQMYIHIEDQPYKGHEKELLALLLLQMKHGEQYQELIKAVREDIAEQEVSLLWAFDDDDLVLPHTAAWFDQNRDKKDCPYVSAMEDLFSLKESGKDGYHLLFDILGATAITGDSIYSGQQKMEKIRKLIEDYLKYLGFDKAADRDSGNKTAYTHKANPGITVEITTITTYGNSKDHINLNVKGRKEFCFEASEERCEAMKKLMEDILGDAGQLPVLTAWQQGEKPDILFTEPSVFVLRNVSDSDENAMKLAGKLLKRIAVTGHIFPKQEQ